MGNAISISIVEDHEVTRDGLAAGLARHEDLTLVGTAGTSAEGLSMVRAKRPDVVLLDLHLPDGSGPKSTVKEFCNVPGTRVVVFSVERRLAFVKVVMSLGASAYLLKSEPLSSIADTIRQVAKGKTNILSPELTGGKDAKITPSEEEVLRLIGRGMKYQDIAEKRYTSPNTVRKQCETLLLKLNLSTREELIAWAVNNGYGSLED